MAEKESRKRGEALTVMRRWMEEDAARFCPPLAKVLHDARTQEGEVNWSTFSDRVAIIDHTNLNPSSIDLQATVTKQYVQYLTDSTYGRAPLSTVTILPDFKQNIDFDRFLYTIKRQAHNELSDTEKGRSLIQDALEKIEMTSGPQAVATIRKANPAFITAWVMENYFNFIDFYGRELSDKDLVGLESERGPIARQRVLSRAPYYTIQVINPFDGDNIITFDKGRLRRNNTIFAINNLREYEQRMNGLRPDRRKRYV